MSDSSLNVIVKLTDQASGGLKSLGEKFEDTASKVDKATAGAQKFTLGVTAVGVAVGGYALSRFADFEKGMSAVQAVTGATGATFDALWEKAKAIGRDTVYTQTEIASAMEELGKQGLTADQILAGAADSVAALASAAGTSLASSATIASSAMTVYNIKAEDMKNVTNQIVGVANASKYSVEDFGLAMSQGGAVARMAWVSFEDFSGALAATAQGFQSGSDAGTSMKVFLQSLVPKSTAAAEAMEKIGFNAYDSSGKMKTLQDIAQNLQDGLSGLTDEQKNYTLHTIFGSDASRMAGLMAEQGAKGIQKMKDVIANTSAEDQAKIRMDNLSGSWERLKGTVDVIAVNIGKVLGEQLRPAIDGVASALENMSTWWASLDSNTQGIIEVIGGVVAAIAGLVFIIGAVGLVLGPVLTAIGTVVSSFGLLVAGGSAVVGVISSILVAIWPIGWVILGISAALFALYEAWKNNWGGMRDIVSTVVTAWVGFFQNLGSQVFDIVKGITTFFSEAWTSIKNTAETVWNTIASIFTTIGNIWLAINLVVIEAILNLFGTSLAEVITTVMTIWTSVKETTSTIWTAIVGVLSSVWTTITGIFNVAIGTIKAIFSAAWDTFKGIAKIGGDLIGGVVSDMWKGITGAFDKGMEFASGSWKKFTDSLGNVMLSTWQGIKDTIASGINWIIDKANAVIASINTATSKAGFTISPIPRVAFQTGGIVEGATGIVPGGSNPANHDQVTANVDPGELILNRAQQSNIANQLTRGSSNDGGGMTVVIKLENNTFHGADPQYAQQIADMIFQNFNTHQAIPSF